MGTEIGMLGCYWFQGQVTAGDGSDKQGKMGAGYNNHPVPPYLKTPLSQSHLSHVLQPVPTCPIWMDYLSFPISLFSDFFWFLVVISLLEKHWSEPVSSSSGLIYDADADGSGTSSSLMFNAMLKWDGLV